MITPILERLILEGKAVFKTHNHGASGVGTIPNPNGSTIIVTDIIYSPFIDTNQINVSINEVFAQSAVLHTLKLQAKQKIANWTFKDSFKINVNADGEYFTTPEPPTVLNTFFVATDDIQINIKAFKTASQFETVIDFVPDETNEIKYPLGYGVTQDLKKLLAVKIFREQDAFSNFVNISPLGNRYPSYFNGLQNEKHDFTANNNLNLNEVVPNTGYNTFPIITFQYVELLEKYTVTDILKQQKR
jgi:hypothetical protein